ncbi:type II toxin-antitoxin system HicB family antitoxin [Synechocystis salina LEGE 06155]|nr:type II toxin-antitoxin system HicB family antitoxin [Synechocystis salina LEGE 06155]
MKIQYTYWQEADGKFLGYLNRFPDHWTQGTDLKDLIENLADLYKTFTENEIPGIKQVAEFELV